MLRKERIQQTTYMSRRKSEQANCALFMQQALRFAYSTGEYKHWAPPSPKRSQARNDVSLRRDTFRIRLVAVGTIVFIFRCFGFPGDEKDATKGCSASIKESDDLVEAGRLEITIKYSRSNDGGESKKYELDGYDSLRDGVKIYK